MDKNNLLAFLLIAVILILTPFYMNVVSPPKPAEAVAAASLSVQPVKTEHAPAITPAAPAALSKPELSETRLDTQMTDAVLVHVETDMYSAEISSVNGGSIRSFRLHQYTMNDTEEVELVTEQNRNNLLLSTFSIDGDPVTLNHPWTMDDTNSLVEISDEPRTLTFKTVALGQVVTKSLTFYPHTYKIDVKTNLTALDENLAEGTFNISWNGGIPVTEKIPKDDIYYFRGYVSQAGEINDPKISKKKALDQKMVGNTDWVAVRSKYFAFALIPDIPGMGAVISGHQEDKEPFYNVGLILSAGQPQNMTLYLGPLEYKRIQKIDGLDHIMTFGWSIIRPISLAVLYVLTFTHRYIPNYGFILILFAIAVKLIVYPLTKKSYQSTKKMQQVQPLLAKLKEKYKSDPQKLNKATMNLYKEQGVNPLGGCLPLLIQMPLLIALFQVFRSTIELRGAPFVLWITDLSAPDTLLHIGSFPLNILPIVMAVTMLFQQMMMPASGGPGQQKSMAYFMNIFMLFIFYRFPSGLNLYYTLFNVLTIVQQKYLTPTDETPVPVPAKAAKKK